MSKYYLTYKLIENDENAARLFCNDVNATATPYQRRKYPAHYTPYNIRDNYGPGMDWNGFICWYHYSV